MLLNPVITYTNYNQAPAYAMDTEVDLWSIRSFRDWKPTLGKVCNYLKEDTKQALGVEKDCHTRIGAQMKAIYVPLYLEAGADEAVWYR